MDYLKRFQSDFPYFIDFPPVGLPISLVEVKEQLRLDPADASQDTYLTLLIEACWICGEQITKTTFLNTDFRTLRNSFVPAIELRRTPFVSLLSFEYTVDGSLIAVDPTLFSIYLKNGFSFIVLNEDKEYPTDGDDILEGIEIKFRAGFGTSLTYPHTDLKLALLNHVSAVYENRGDCDAASIMKSIPNTTRQIYNKNKIIEAS